MTHFKVLGFEKDLYKMFKGFYPDNIKLQVLYLLVELYSLENLDMKYIKNSLDNYKLYTDYLDFISKKISLDKSKLNLMQAMFYGDCDSSGKGNSGGLCVLLKSLGNQLSSDDKVSMITTLTLGEDWDTNKPFIDYYTPKHCVIRLPIYLDSSNGDMFLKRQLFIKRFILKFIKSSNLLPDVFHIRYLDNASKAISLLSKELNKKLVFTLTPDPHRNMCNSRGELEKFKVSELLEKLDKIMIGDELLETGDGILGIGNDNIKEDLKLYFPQLLRKNFDMNLKMVAEGIKPSIVNEDFNLSEIHDEKFFSKPIILNVGRLSRLKGQDNLLRAFGESTLPNDYNLLIIGGDLKKPNAEERYMKNFFKEYIEKKPSLKDKFCHLPAMSNDLIRTIESEIMKREENLPNIYLCSSKKEEFGISILEALSEKFLVLAPKKGGVKTYIQNGVNGFLIDTSDWQSILKDIENIIYDLDIDKKEFNKIKFNGSQTVKKYFSIDKIAQDFLSFYMIFKGSEKIEI